jgi:DNA-binding MarR family transcriptional regulator
MSAMAIMARLFRFNTLASRNIEQTFRQYGLHQGEFDVLATLYHAGKPYALTPKKLVTALLLSSGAMTNRLDRLEQAGLLARTPSPDDRRSIIVSLTAQGLNRVQEALDQYLTELEALLAPLSPAQRKQMTALLKRLLTAHDQHSPGGISL